MKYIKILISILILLIGGTLLSITVYDEPFTTARLKITGVVIYVVGVVLLNRTFTKKKQQ